MERENQHSEGLIEKLSAGRVGTAVGIVAGSATAAVGYISNAIQGCYGYGNGCMESPVATGMVLGTGVGICTALYIIAHQKGM